MSLDRRVGALLAAWVVLGATGCQLVVSFDRDRIPTDGGDAGRDTGLDAGPPCGDGRRDTGETCDDGNTVANDGCSSSCRVEDGWSCDEAEPSECTAICGDGMQVGDEVCDDGNQTACGVCNADCTAAGSGRCGDSTLCEDNEQCDDGDAEPNDGCSATCQIETGWVCGTELPSVCAMTCGNGVVDASPIAEGCDDGGNTANDGCSPMCTIEPGWLCTGTPSSCVPDCGDGMVIAPEQCDDGNETPGDGCSATCAPETGFMCPPAGGACMAVCGDGMILGGEVCDDGNQVTETACAYGTRTCGGCRADCGMSITGLVGRFCGDGMLEAGREQCDDGVDPAVGGDGCSATCTIEPGFACPTPGAACTPVCGDGTRVTGETCDDANAAACGGCSANCQMLQRPASSTITISGTPADADTVTINDGTNTVRFEFDHLAAARLTTGTGDAELVWTADEIGLAGDTISVTIASGAALTVAVSGRAITVTVPAVGAAATAIAAAVNADAAAGPLVTVTVGGNGTGTVTPTGPTNLSGGGGNGVTPTNIPIDILPTAPAAAAAAALRSAIDGVTTGLLATAMGATEVTTVTNERVGAASPHVAVVSAVITSAVVVAGSGSPCAAGIGCTAASDCASLSCSPARVCI